MNIIITEKTRRGVAYLSVDSQEGPQLQGTVFFIDLAPSGHQSLTYAVTAQHCLAGIDTELYLEFTGRDGKYQRIATRPEQWDRSPVTDAACRIMTPLEREPLHRIDQAQAWRSDMGLEAGYEVYIIGLFSKAPYYGQDQNTVEPIVRFGRISHPSTLAPVYFDPKDQGKSGKEKMVKATLVECISFGGESGSPVFICEDYTKDPNLYSGVPLAGLPRNVRLTDVDVPTQLLGLLSAHWKIGEFVRTRRKRKPTPAEVGLNSGIAVVIPIIDILKFIMEDPQIEKRREAILKKQ